MTQPMINSKLDPTTCADVQTALPEYVRRELTNAPVAQIYPDLTEHIESCDICEPLYYREFRRQGREKSLLELAQVGQRAAVAGVMAQILGSAPPATVAAVVQEEGVGAAQPNNLAQWHEVALAQGRGWRDEATAAWRQVELVLGNWRGGLQQAPALSGLMGSDEVHTDVHQEWLAVALEGANFELRVELIPQPAPSTLGELCELEVTVTLYDRFGDYSGVAVTLLHPPAAQQQVTDALGKVCFAAIPADQLPHMRLLIQLPEA